MAVAKERWASLISGSGSTMDAMARAIKGGEVSGIVPACVISSTDNAGGLEKAQRRNIDVFVVDRDRYRNGDGTVDQYGFGQVILKILKLEGVDFITQNGWMPLTPENVIDAYKDSIYNQHPAPVPEFGGPGMFGIRPHAAILEFMQRTTKPGFRMATEVVVQRVDKEFDKGAVLHREIVFIEEGDTPEGLQKRALPVEHEVQMRLLKSRASGVIQERAHQSWVKPGEEHILKEAKLHAIARYPKG